MKAFPMLNTLRFISATGVLIQHAEEIKHHAGLSNIYALNGIKMLGGVCVSAFFVLSGFLITYILFYEKQQTATIDLKSFYKKRILRIWPLYFTTIILYKIVLAPLPIESKAFIFTNSNFSFGNLSPVVEIGMGLEWLFLILLLPHVLLALGKVFYPLHVWSIGVEEMFYLFWPLIIRKTRQYRKTFLIILLGYLALYVFSFSLWIYLLKTDSTSAKYLQSTTFFLYCQRISCMALGALGAETLFFNREKILHFIRHPFILAATPVLIVYGFYKGFFFPVFITEVYCILFIALILQIIHWGEKIISNPIYRLTEELGTISFGIYMYHPFCIVLTIEIISQLNLSDISSWVFYPLATGFTFIISYLSYRFMEAPVLRLKNLMMNKPATRVSIHS